METPPEAATEESLVMWGAKIEEVTDRSVAIYEPFSRQELGFFRTWVLMGRNIARSRDLIYQLFRRDFLATYKKSFLGIIWVVVAPMLGIASWVIMNAAGVLQPGNVGIPYPAYVLLSTSIWGLFIGFYSAAAGTLAAGNGFILQVKYSHEVLLVKQLAQHLAGFLITFALNLLVLLAFHVLPSWKIVFFPILILPLLFLGSGLGLIIGVFGVVTSEVQRAADVLFGLLIWVTPVIYSQNIRNPILQEVVRWNPLTYLVGGIRDVVIYGRLDDARPFLISSAGSFLLFLVAWRLFFLTEDRVIERMV
jgi:lipopolysaccharide transport system permease protein